MLYTKKGDDGMSGLFGTKERFSKNSQIYEALGNIDELNSLLGICYTKAKKTPDDTLIYTEIRTVQEALFIIQAELAGAPKKVTNVHISELEMVINRIESLIQNPHAFVIPGGTDLSAFLDFARAVARRAERAIIGLIASQSVSTDLQVYLNRLSSLLYALARYAVTLEEGQESFPTY